MSKSILTFATALLFIVGSASIMSCGNAEQSHSEESHEHQEGEDHGVEEHQHASIFQCPMQCEGDKTYDEAGKCPKCGMDLEAVEEQHDHHGEHAEEEHGHDDEGSDEAHDHEGESEEAHDHDDHDHEEHGHDH